MSDNIHENLIMWSAAEIAARDGVTKQAVSKTVQAIIAVMNNVPVERDSRSRVLRISLAHYDHHRERFMNPAKMAMPPAEKTFQGDSFEEAKRQSEWMKVSREKIRLDEEVSSLIRADKVSEAAQTINHEISLIVHRLQNRADDLAAIVAKEGVHGARVALRAIAFDMSNEIADRLVAIAEDAPEFDPLIEELPS
ncbi:conserved hypothetical protein [Agrobacterium deltaense Zutra 3/1]|uniref:Uncharacterized protein n=1 Tax=Agrobacterium deltaense Zutra 3/1 TaxID=1183427 RepID=A0A1S7PLJ3_9HYPH|nr:hypothetical protein [Agrobacterium deltaense]CUX23186.1 conserved hypothetical protein [Agrobacterium deltaense Zutra 3/1]